MTGSKILRTLCIHAIRSLTDYATPALNTLFGCQWEKLEVVQNNAMSHCQGTNVEKKILNLHMETGLISPNQDGTINSVLCNKTDYQGSGK
ncbi:hypothetical protein Hamer_G003544 [Homarus americanus]|uniref:Uncharacterized protein n=1 Tax=Homarus americanus TaxID=6706 RepID=A0A8J5JZM7_HOMAM|nr:hypothetical protein Hamer_G003544 [Homarus americanus]